ncbi:hypothetical protein VPH35_032931 [Triticum aestivum]
MEEIPTVSGGCWYVHIEGGRRSSAKPRGFKTGTRKLRLCIRDERGIRICDDEGAAMLRTTPLGREVALREDLRAATSIYHQLKSMGMFKWKAYKEQRQTIRGLIRAIHQAATRYKDRRLDAGFFYLVPREADLTVEVRSHLYHMPLREAVRRCRLELQKRRDVLENKSKAASSSQGQAHVSDAGTAGWLSPAARFMLWTTLSSVVLGCIIVRI